MLVQAFCIHYKTVSHNIIQKKYNIIPGIDPNAIVWLNNSYTHYCNKTKNNYKIIGTYLCRHKQKENKKKILNIKLNKDMIFISSFCTFFV